MSWLKKLLAGPKDKAPARITRQMALDVLEKTGYSLQRRFTYISPVEMKCCAVGLASLYALGEGATLRMFSGDETFGSDLVAVKTGYSMSYLDGLEEGFEGWDLLVGDGKSFNEGYEDGLALRELAIGGDSG